MIFLKESKICTFKDPNCAQNFTNLVENLFDKIKYRGAHAFCFYLVCSYWHTFRHFWVFAASMIFLVKFFWVFDLCKPAYGA